MKKFLLLVNIFLTSFFIQGQGSWQVCLNKKTIVTGSESNELLNTKKINQKEWIKNGYLEINYKEVDTGFWKRSFQFEDETGFQLFSKDSTTKVKIPIPELRKLYAGKREIKIYTVASPLDPNIMVRMQRVHLCTLKLH